MLYIHENTINIYISATHVDEEKNNAIITVLEKAYIIEYTTIPHSLLKVTLC